MLLRDHDLALRSCGSRDAFGGNGREDIGALSNRRTDARYRLPDADISGDVQDLRGQGVLFSLHLWIEDTQKGIIYGARQEPFFDP